MGAFAQYLEKNKINAVSLARVSALIEAGGDKDAAARAARAKARADKKSYAELTIAKPASGRGISTWQIESAIQDKPLAKRARTKLVRALRRLTKNDALDAKTLFGEVRPKKGLRRIEAAKKKAAAGPGGKK